MALTKSSSRLERGCRGLRPRLAASIAIGAGRVTPNLGTRSMSQQSIRRLFAIALTGLILETPLMQTAFAADKVSLFKVITTKDEIVIGLSDAELSQMDGHDAGGVAKMLIGKGTLSVWQYAVRHGQSGDLEQAPLRKVALISNDSLRIEPYSSPLKVVPIDESQK
jgi:hypothetical protein